ncbi:MAG: hypothetical protein RMJ33_00845 [Saprospiraceae bacterium]|nr:hypothetical protein [Saprospiraceae bacterium]MDW8228355.1 hypothetical protein [Saprospiraceae bacterium]
MRYLLSALLWLLTVASARTQSPWVRAANSGYVQMGYHAIPAYRQLFGRSGSDLPLVRYVTEQTLQLYGEYGLDARTTAIVSLPWRMHERGRRTPELPLFISATEDGQISGFGNISLALRRQLSNGPLVLSGALRLDLPSVLNQPNTGLRTGFNAFTVQPSLSVGQSAGRLYWFVYSSLALRTNNCNHYLNTGAEAGLSVGPLWFIAFLDIVLPFESDSRPLQPARTRTGLYENNQGWLSPGGKVLWQVMPRWGIVVSGATALWAQYVPKNPGISAAVFYRW